jgi:hypothetical protein
LRTQRAADARATGERLNIAELNAEVEKLAALAVEGVDPTKVEPAKAYSWAQLFSLAKKHKETCSLCELFLTTKPSAELAFAAQTLMLGSCQTLGEGDMIASTLPNVAPGSFGESQTLLRNAINYYADTILEDLGIDAAFRAIDVAASKLILEDPAAYAARNFESYKRQAPKNADGSAMTDEQITASLRTSGQTVNSSFPYMVANKKAELLIDAGKSKEGLKVLKDFVASVDSNNAYARRATGAIKQIEMIGQPAIALNFDKKYGEFKSLEEWRGKVVIIDFTAHW